MKRIRDAEQRIRAVTNQQGMHERYFNQRYDDWNRLCVAMDTLGDPTCALLHFEAYGLGSTVDERYIRLYGTLQAIILQQDAIETIYEIYIRKKPDIRPDSAWKKCRRLRNLAAGHPLDAHGDGEQRELRVFLSRTTITDKGFDLLIFPQKEPYGPVKKSVDFKTPYNSYKREAHEILEKVIKHLKDLAAKPQTRSHR